MLDRTARKRGALPTPRSILASATPHAAGLIGAPPQYIAIPQTLSMWGNDVHGDCVTAEEAFAKACYQPEIFIAEQEAIDWATSHGVLEGAYIYQVLDWMVNDGFHQDGQNYDDGGSQSVDWQTSSVLKDAISQGPVKLGIAADQLSAVWQHQNGWFATGWHADANEDHSTSALRLRVDRPGWRNSSTSSARWCGRQPAGLRDVHLGHDRHRRRTVDEGDHARGMAPGPDNGRSCRYRATRMHVCARGSDGALWHNWQTAPNNGWSGWQLARRLDRSDQGGDERRTGVSRSSRVAATVPSGTTGKSRRAAPGAAGIRSAAGSTGSMSSRTRMAVSRSSRAAATVPSGICGRPRRATAGAAGTRSAAGSTCWMSRRNADGRLEIFARGGDGAVWHMWQTAPSNGWSGWYSLGGWIDRLNVASQRGRPDGDLRSRRRWCRLAYVADRAEQWLERLVLARRLDRSAGNGRNADGRLEIFARGGDGAVWHMWQTAPSNGWSGWYSLGGWIDLLKVASNDDGRMEVFARGGDAAVWHMWQTAPSNGWSGWYSLGGWIDLLEVWPQVPGNP